MPAPKITKNDDGSFTIEGLEVFRAGDYGAKGRFARADVETIAKRFDPKVAAAPLTLDHKQEGPAFGWVQSLRAVGDVLVATIGKVPAAFVERIREGAWSKPSVEIFKNLPRVGGLYLKAVTLLGAAAPEVTGLTGFDQATFAGDVESVSVDFAEAALPGGMIPFRRPEGSTAGAIVAEIETQKILGHFHIAALDVTRSGWTCHGVAVDGHQHVVKDGKVLPAKDANGVEHTHQLASIPPETAALFTSHQEASNMTAEEQAKADAEKAAAAAKMTAATLTPEQAAAILAENEDLKKRLAALEADSMDTKMSASLARFGSAWERALDRGAVTPAQRDGELALFSSLPLTGPASVKFSRNGAEATGTARDAYLAALDARPAATVKRTEAIAPTARFTAADNGADSLDRKVLAFQSEQGKAGIKLSYEQALVEYIAKAAEASQA